MPSVRVDVENITFGCEMECGLPATTAARIGLDVGEYRHGLQIPGMPDGWRASHDGSVAVSRCVSFECVSPILKGVAGLREAMLAAETLGGWGARVNGTCGFHVHVGCNDPKTVHRLANFAANHETGLYATTGTRRRELTSWCKSVRAGFRGLRFDRARISDWGGNAGDRYMAINLTNLINGSRPTVEFRLFGGTVNPVKIVSYIRLSVAMVERAMSTDRPVVWEPKLRREPTGARELSRMLHVLGWLNNAGKRPVFGNLVGNGLPTLEHSIGALNALAAKYDMYTDYQARGARRPALRGTRIGRAVRRPPADGHAGGAYTVNTPLTESGETLGACYRNVTGMATRRTYRTAAINTINAHGLVGPFAASFLVRLYEFISMRYPTGHIGWWIDRRYVPLPSERIHAAARQALAAGYGEMVAPFSIYQAVTCPRGGAVTAVLLEHIAAEEFAHGRRHAGDSERSQVEIAADISRAVRRGRNYGDAELEQIESQRAALTDPWRAQPRTVGQPVRNSAGFLVPPPPYPDALVADALRANIAPAWARDTTDQVTAANQIEADISTVSAQIQIAPMPAAPRPTANGGPRYGDGWDYAARHIGEDAATTLLETSPLLCHYVATPADCYAANGLIPIDREGNYPAGAVGAIGMMRGQGYRVTPTSIDDAIVYAGRGFDPDTICRVVRANAPMCVIGDNDPSGRDAQQGRDPAYTILSHIGMRQSWDLDRSASLWALGLSMAAVVDGLIYCWATAMPFETWIANVSYTATTNLPRFHGHRSPYTRSDIRRIATEFIRAQPSPHSP